MAIDPSRGASTSTACFPLLAVAVVPSPTSALLLEAEDGPELCGMSRWFFDLFTTQLRLGGIDW